jgi:hypothetical protein
MAKQDARDILQMVQAGELTPDEALLKLRLQPSRIWGTRK